MLVAVTLLTHFWMIPYAQKSANSHMNDGPFLGVVYVLLAFSTLVFAIKSYQKRRSTVELILQLLLMVVFIGFGYQLYSLDCLTCASMG